MKNRNKAIVFGALFSCTSALGLGFYSISQTNMDFVALTLIIPFIVFFADQFIQAIGKIKNTKANTPKKGIVQPSNTNQELKTIKDNELAA